MLDLGHRRIGFIGEPPQNLFGFVSSARRQDGYEASLLGAGIELDHDGAGRGCEPDLLGVRDEGSAR